MANERVEKPASWLPQIQAKTSQFAARPFADQPQTPTQQEIEPQAFSNNQPSGTQMLEIPNFFGPRTPASSPPIQTKLTIGEPGDRYEQEADRVASQVVEQINSPKAPQSTQGQSVQRQEEPVEEIQAKPSISGLQRSPLSSEVQREDMPEEEDIQAKSILQRQEEPEEEIQAKPSISNLQRSPSSLDVQREAMPEEEEPQAKSILQRQEEPEEEIQAKPSISNLQRSPSSLEVQREAMPEEEDIQAKSILQRREEIAGGEATNDLDTAINSARGGGQSLDAGLQRSMGQAMGADFSGVKVHTDAQSDQLNQSIQAKAFTTGQDVFFRQGAYEPGSRGGQELIAHELTHVVQQNGGAVQRSRELGIQQQIDTQITSLPPISAPLISRKPDGTTGRLEEKDIEDLESFLKHNELSVAWSTYPQIQKIYEQLKGANTQLLNQAGRSTAQKNNYRKKVQQIYTRIVQETTQAPNHNQRATGNAENYMVEIANAQRGWEYIKGLYKQSALKWEGGEQPESCGLDAIHKRRKYIIETSINNVKAEVKRQVCLKRFKLQNGLGPDYVPNDEDQPVMEQIMSNIKELGGGGLGSNDPTSDVDVTLTGDGTDIAVELLNEEYKKTPEGQTGISFAYLYDVNYYPAAFVPEKDAILAQKAFSSNREQWRDETITDPEIKGRIDENEQITAWLHVKLDVSPEQWEPMNKMLEGQIIQHQKNKNQSNSKGTFAEEVIIRAEKRESVGKEEQGNARLVTETEEFGKVSAEVFDARERYLEAKRQEDEYIKYLLSGKRADEDTIFMQERLDTLRKPVELAYADLMEGMDKAGVYANEGMFTSGAIRVVVANMQVLGIDWENKNSQPESIENIKIKSSNSQNSSVEQMSKDESKTREQKRAVHEEILRGNRKLKLKGNELYNSIIEHYGRILHVLNSFGLSGNPTEGIAKVGKYLHRYYRSVYDWQQLQGKKGHIITRNELLYAQQLEGVKKQKTRALNEAQREVAGIEDIPLWSSANGDALTNASIEAMENLFDIRNGKEISMMALRSHVEKKITDIFNLVNTQLSKS